MSQREAEKSLAFAASVASEQVHLREVMQSALTKLETSMLDGPDGEPATLTPEEATILYRYTEMHGLRHENKRH